MKVNFYSCTTRLMLLIVPAEIYTIGSLLCYQSGRYSHFTNKGLYPLFVYLRGRGRSCTENSVWRALVRFPGRVSSMKQTVHPSSGVSKFIAMSGQMGDRCCILWNVNRAGHRCAAAAAWGYAARCANYRLPYLGLIRRFNSEVNLSTEAWILYRL